MQDEERRPRIYDKTGGYCHHCNRKLAWTNNGAPDRRGAWEIDHSKPKSLGGTDHLNNLEVWPETRFSPSQRFLNVDWRCNSGFLKHIAYTTMPYKTGLRLLGVARNPANGFPARLLVVQLL